MDIDAVVFAGAGRFGLIYIGALVALQQAGVVHRISKVAGVSSGGVVALFAACRLDALDLFSAGPVLHKVIEASDAQYVSGCCSCATALARILMYNGIGDLDKIIQPLKTFMIEHLVQKQVLAPDATDIDFATLHAAYGVDTFLSAVDLVSTQQIVFSRHTTPSLSVFEALKASMSVGVMFPPTIIEGRPYVDGAFMNNFPLSLFDDHNDDGGTIHDGTLGIVVHTLPSPSPPSEDTDQVKAPATRAAADLWGAWRCVPACFSTLRLLVRLLLVSFRTQVTFSASARQHFFARNVVEYRVDVDAREIRTTHVLQHAKELHRRTAQHLHQRPPSPHETAELHRLLGTLLGLSPTAELDAISLAPTDERLRGVAHTMAAPPRQLVV